MSELNGHMPEHELLEFIEGVLPPAREAVVSAALARDPRLARLVAAMQEDRQRLMAMGDVQAPPELAERVEAILERQALLGLSDLADSSAPVSLPVSRLRPSRGPIVARIWRSPAGRGLVAAAAVALLAGGGYWGYTASTSFRRAASVVAQAGDGGGAIALNTSEDAPPDAAAIEAPGLSPVEVAAAPEVEEPAEPEATVEVAAAVGEIESLAATGAAVIDAVSDAAVAVATPAPSVAGPARDEITPAMAVELARRGLLAIVVESVDADAAVMRVEAIAGSGAGGTGRSASWRRIDGGVAGGALDAGFETVAALWSPHFAPELEIPTPFLAGSPTTAVAGDASLAPALGPGPRVPMELPRWTPSMSQPVAVYTVSLEDRESALASLVAALRKDGSAGGPARTARFVRLPVAIDPAPAADPDAVLWWTGAPSNWTWRISVPVVVRRGPGR